MLTNFIEKFSDENFNDVEEIIPDSIIIRNSGNRSSVKQETDGLHNIQVFTYEDDSSESDTITIIDSDEETFEEFIKTETPTIESENVFETQIQEKDETTDSEEETIERYEQPPGIEKFIKTENETTESEVLFEAQSIEQIDEAEESDCAFELQKPEQMDETEEAYNTCEPRITWRSLFYWQASVVEKKLKKDTSIFCADCRQKFSYITFLNHVRFLHYDKLKFCCDVCNKYFIDRRELSSHRNIHNMNENTIQPKIYMCSECARSYKSKDERLNHIKYSHPAAYADILEYLRTKAERDKKAKLLAEGKNITTAQVQSENKGFNTLKADLKSFMGKSIKTCKYILKVNKPEQDIPPQTIEINETILEENENIQKNIESEIISADNKVKRLKRKQPQLKTDHSIEKIKVLKESITQIKSTSKSSKIIKKRKVLDTNDIMKKENESTTNDLIIPGLGTNEENSILTVESKKFVLKQNNRLTCKKCGEQSSTDEEFQLHLKKHTSLNPHTCKVCLKTFSIFYDLMNHMNSHSKELPFRCQKCLERFRLKGTLLVHIDRHAQPFVCEMCSKGFKNKARLSDHMLSHI